MKGSKITAGMEEFRKTSLPFLLTCYLIIHTISAATDSINSSQTIRDGETVVSSGGIFELGFFSPGNSTNRYVGMWYKNITDRTYVWVANREAPLTNKSGVLKVMEPGILAVLYDTGAIIWSSNKSRSVQNPVAQLLDSGNLVVKDADDDRPENFLWQSFDYPSDTFLSGMGLGWNYVTGVETYLSSWRSNDDPTPGEFTMRLDPTGYPQVVLKKGNTVQHRLGPWNGLRFSGAPDTINGSIYMTTLQMDKNEVRGWEEILDQSIVSRSTVRSTGDSPLWIWNNRTQGWAIYANFPADNCDTYNLCGAYGNCNIGNAPSCGCLERFVPKDLESWSRTDWSKGCVRRTNLSCQGDGFLKYSGIKLPDSRYSTPNDQRRILSECEADCLRDCNCTAYTQLNISNGGSGCLFYHGELIDIRALPTGGQDLYIRMASTELDVPDSKGKKKKGVVLIASITSVAGIVLVCLSLILFYIQKRKKDLKMRKKGAFTESHGKEAELPFFNLSAILKATDHFLITNKLGEGGFGPVYRGKLEDGQEIAVKRLSKTSSQGVDELENEVILIAKLQHRNLVRLLGCCTQAEENMLIYEYMPNSSLNLILFDQMKSMLLDWQKRFHIIKGIAKGLLYLHQDSRLRIIHRDLKASNILLDADMNPKISDFGIARGFGGNETEAKTHRVVGTYGYMSPEYAIDGLFSVKSDVFSFGVLVLEIVSGKRNRGFSLKDHNLNLLGHAWTLYKEDNTCKLVDASLGDSFDLSEVLRSIHVGLLCVQQYPEDRPTMSSVVFMLENEVALPQVKQPGFFTERDVFAGQSSSSTRATNSENLVTITLPEGR